MHALEPIYALMRQSRFDEAERALAPMLAQASDDPGPHRAHAALMQVRGRADEAIASMRRALELAPEDAALRQAYGQVLVSAGRAGDAIVAFREATILAPQTSESWYLLGMCLYGARRDAEALPALRRAHALAPAHAQVARALAETAYALEHHAEALALFERIAASMAAAAQPVDAMLSLRLSQCRRRLGAPQHALAALREAVERFPGEASLRFELGWVCEDLGNAASAQEAYLCAHALQPDWGDPLGAAIALLRADAPDALLRSAEALAVNAQIPQHQRAFLHHALGKSSDGRGRYADAARHWAAANALRRHCDGGFDRGAYAVRIDALIAAFAPERIPMLRAAALRDERPLFVLGMPRTGTTLVEQILAAHPMMHGCGETVGIERIVEAIVAEPSALGAYLRWPEDAAAIASEAVPTITHEWLRERARRYLEDLARAAPAHARRLIDKQPYNFLHVGLIAMLFADARVVWCRRDPRDVALSIFSESFAPSATYATDLGDIAFVIAEQERLMRHWQASLPLPMLEVEYEALVTDPETQSRRLIEFAGLPWDDACLRFYAGDRAVQTHSRWQVRQPVHARSIGRWRNYPRWFRPSDRSD